MSQSLYAGFIRRAGASLIDGFLASLPGTAAAVLGFTTGAWWLDAGIEALVWWPYYALFHASRWQATPGKRAFGIKVTDLQGNRIGFDRATVRYFASYLSALSLLVGYLMAAFTRKRQALHDFMAGTLVVNAEMAPSALPADHQVMPLPPRVAGAVAGLVLATIAWMWVVSYLEGPSEAQPVEQGAAAGPSTGPSFEIAYALYKFPLFGGEPTLVKEGTRTYTLGDVQVRPGPAAGVDSVVKRLAIAEGFDIEAHIYREPSIDGFGLSLEKDHGFSWEWFDRESAETFRKRQGPGRIKVRVAQFEDGRQEVAEIVFLEDVTLRLDRNFMIPLTADKTDHLVVRKGSVLSLR